MAPRAAHLAPLVVLVVVACGDDSSGSGGSSTSTSSTAATGSGVTTTTATATTGAGGEAAAGGGSATTTSGSGGGGGSAVGPHDDEFRSGSRLRAVVLDAGGAAQQPVAWYDTELAIECVPTLVGDTYRCVPDGRTPRVHFRDAACTEPVITVRDCDDPPYATLLTPTGCTTATVDVYHAVGATESLAQVYRSSGGGCSPEAGPIDVQAAELEPAESFVRFDVAREDLDAEVARDTLATDDGAFGILRAVDRGRDEACLLQRPAPADAAHRCVPFYSAWQETNVAYWAEATCTEPALTGSNCTVLEATGPILQLTRDACGAATGEMHERGEILPNVWETFGDAASCAEQSSALPGVALGPVIDPATFPELDELEHTGDALVLTIDARGDRAIGDATSWRIAETDEPCNVIITADGDRRCVPSLHAHVSGTLFADAACTEPLAFLGPAGCATPTYAVVQTSAPVCGDNPLTNLYRVGPPVGGARYALDDQGTCAETTTSDAYDYGLVLEELPFDTLPLVERVVD